MLLVVLFFIQWNVLISQGNNPVLFSVGNEDVYLSEFKYIYEKNNAKKADYSKESVDEYLDLYKKFKLKVHKAKDVGLDTVKSLQDELAGYRKQLAKSYLKDKEISERLIDEVVVRMSEDVEVSHIFVALAAKATEAEQLAALKKANDIYAKLMEGASFELMAKTLSEDKSSSSRNGHLGYYTSPLPHGFYAFENGLYNTPIGQVSEPVRSKMGYHILKVMNRRPARGQIELAHILIRKKSTYRTLQESRVLIDSIYNLLQEGRSYENMASKFSEDNKTKQKGGYLGYIGINQYENPFEDAAFAIQNNDIYSTPIETSIGFHIIKRINKRDDSNIDLLKKRIKSRIENNDRFAVAEKKLIDDIKKEGNFSENKEILNLFIDELNDDFFSYKWTAPQFHQDKKLFQLDGQNYTLNNFSQYVKNSVKDRLKFNKVKSFDQAVEELYNRYVDEEIMSFEEKNLENKYPDFKALMREYREGILLFEITKMEVWDKASQDTKGLNEFFENNNEKYRWDERVKAIKYSIKSENDQTLISVYKFAQKKDHDKIIDKYKEDPGVEISWEEMLFSRSDKLIKDMPLKIGALSELNIDKQSAVFYKFIGMVAPTTKTLSEAKGYVIADYQDYLEKQWLDELSKLYPIRINKSVLKSLIK